MTIKELRTQLDQVNKKRRKLAHGPEREALWTEYQQIKAEVARRLRDWKPPADAPKTCILCQHFSFDPGDHGYSEVTPGYGWSMGCRKHHWQMEGYDVTQQEYTDNLLTAQDCPDFRWSQLLKELS